MPDKTTLIVTSIPNPENMQALQAYIQGVMPLFLEIGGVVVKRSKITDDLNGHSSFSLLLVMDFPKKKALVEMFESDAYEMLIPLREQAFLDINILLAEDL